MAVFGTTQLVNVKRPSHRFEVDEGVARLLLANPTDNRGDPSTEKANPS
jgi:hypothetical protein